MKIISQHEVLNEDKLILQLFVSGMSPKSLEAIQNIKRLSDKFTPGTFELEIIDIYKNPQIAVEQSIVFSPSLIKQFPFPKKILIGTLADSEKVSKALGITFRNSE